MIPSIQTPADLASFLFSILLLETVIVASLVANVFAVAFIVGAIRTAFRKKEPRE